jgi:Polyketide cyclase / dehydrase and lipid transport
MAHYHATIESPCGPAETFDYLATFSNAEQWDPGVLSGEQLDSGPVQVGTRFRLVVPFLGRRLPLTYVVTRYSPAGMIALEAASGLLRLADWIEVAGEGDGATVSYDADVRLRGPLRLLDPMLQRGFGAVGDRAAAGLAAVLAGRSQGVAGVPGGMVGGPEGAVSGPESAAGGSEAAG